MFRSFMALVCPEYEVPSHTTMTSYIRDLYVKEKEKVIEKLSAQEFVLITTDRGTSSNAVSFQDISVHYLDKDLHMQCHTLAV